MAWKHDLEKLKRQLGPEALAAASKVAPRPVVKPAGSIPIEDEDAVFLSAMGLKPARTKPSAPPSVEDAQQGAAHADQPAPDTFQEAVKDLKGLKPLAQGLPDMNEGGPPGRLAPSTSPLMLPHVVAEQSPATTSDRPAPMATPVVAMLPPAPLPELPVELVRPTPSPATETTSLPCLKPLRFQLAAGMAIEVDGSLDLRGHSLADAMERLKDRLGDCKVLNWRTLQVTLGTDAALHESLLDMLEAGRAPMVARYAQAPVPMGGAQAWLLYLGAPSANPDARG